MDLLYKVRKIVERDRLIAEGEKVLVGVSGGIDSTALLCIFREIAPIIPFEMALAHVNHQLRGEESQRDEDFLRALAEEFSLPIHVGRVDVGQYAKTHGLSAQHAARNLRYGFFHETAAHFGYDKIALAHNLDDRVETFLLRLFKGTGVRGLTSIPPRREKIVRPLLSIYRSEIEHYMTERKLPHMEDSSNYKTFYERNYVRREVIPLIENLNPAFKEKIARLLADLSSIDRFFQVRAAAYREEAVQSEGERTFLDIAVLKGLDEETRFRLLSGAIYEVEPGFVPLREHVTLVEKLIGGDKPNASVVLPLGLKAKRTYDRLVFTKTVPAPPDNGIYPITLGENVLDPLGLTLRVSLYEGDITQFSTDPWTALLDADKTGTLHVRNVRQGDRFIPLGMDKKVKLKDFLISRKVALEQRRKSPLLLSDGDIAWVIGVRISEDYKVGPETHRFLKVVARFRTP
jgi:tRNA(Ile)-lysidine synthase